MAFWSKWLERRSSPERPSVSLANPDAWVTELFGGGRSDSGISITPDKALSISTVWQCVTLLTDDFAKLPTYVFKNNEATGGRERDTAHAAYTILRRKANKNLTAGQFKKTLLFHTLLYGNGYAWITRNGRMEPEELIILDPTRTQPQMINDSLFYVTYVKDEKKVLAADEVFHLRGVGFDGIRGYSIIEHACNSFGLTLAAEKYGSKHFSNGTRVSGVLQYPGRLTAEAARGLQKSFQDRHEGLDNAHKTILLEEGAKFIPTTQTPNEAQFIALREFQRKEIGGWFKIPPSKLGDSDSVSYNSLEQSNQAYLESALDPWLFAFEEEAFDKLLTERQKRSESHFVEFNRNALLRTDQESRNRSYAIGRQWGWLSINDIRAKENEERIGPEGDVYLVPANMMAAEHVLNPPEPPAPPAGAAETDETIPKKDVSAPKKPAGGQPGKREEFVAKATPLIEGVVGRAARRLVESGRKAIVKEDWPTTLAVRLNDHWKVLSESLSPALDALSLTRADAKSTAVAATVSYDRTLNVELDGLFVGLDREARVAAWDEWSEKFLNDLVPLTVDAIVKAYDE